MHSLDDIRRLAVARQFGSSGLAAALEQLGFVQADPIRAPARAQDLTLRHRVEGYRAGDLERLYQTLPIEEDFFINYGFVSRRVSALMHPREGAGLLPSASNKRAQAVLQFVRDGGEVHPRDVDAHFAHGRVTNYWGGSSSATTHLLELMHYKGLVRVARREAGIRIYAVHQHGVGRLSAAERQARLDALVDVVVRKYAPLPATSLSSTVRRLRYAVPQWTSAHHARPQPRETALRARRHRRRDVVLACRRIDRSGTMCPMPCGCSHRSIRWCGIVASSSSSGIGRTDSKRTRLPPNASTATTRCRCCGGIG